jgi:hypothetical protein
MQSEHTEALWNDSEKVHIEENAGKTVFTPYNQNSAVSLLLEWQYKLIYEQCWRLCTDLKWQYSYIYIWM